MGQHSRNNTLPTRNPEDVAQSIIDGTYRPERRGLRGRVGRTVGAAALLAVTALGIGGARAGAFDGMGKLMKMEGGTHADLTPGQAQTVTAASKRMTANMVNIEEAMLADPAVQKAQSGNTLELHDARPIGTLEATKTFTAWLDEGEGGQKVVNLKYRTSAGTDPSNPKLAELADSEQATYPTNAPDVASAIAELGAHPETVPIEVESAAAGPKHHGGSSRILFETDQDGRVSAVINPYGNDLDTRAQERLPELVADELDQTTNSLDQY